MIRYVKRLILFLTLFSSLLLPHQTLATPHIDSVTATMIGSDPDCRYYIYEVRAKVNNAIWCDCITLNDYFMVYVEYPAILRETTWAPKYPCNNGYCHPQSVEEIILVGVPPGATLAIKVVAGTPLAGYGGLWKYSLAQAPSEPPQNCECELSINVYPSEVSPQKGGSANTTSTIMVTATNPPPEGCTVDLKVEPVKDSGGHIESGHIGDRNNHKGSIKDITLTIPSGSSQASTTYQSNEVSGEEKIIAEVSGEKKSETTIQVKVPGFISLGGGYYSLKTQSSDNKHTGVYNVSPWVKGLFDRIALTYNQKFPNNEMLVVTDASLAWGGLYDFKNTWNPPHNTHRIGTDIDVRSRNIPEGKNRELFERFVCRNYGFPDLEFHGEDNEHYHLYFLPYNSTVGSLCKGELPL